MRRHFLRLLHRAGSGTTGKTLPISSASCRALIQHCEIDATRVASPVGLSSSSSFAVRGITSSSLAAAEALTEVKVQGNAEGVIKELDRIVSSEDATAKDVADAAVALAYLQVKGDRRIWGKVFEKAAAVKSSFDAVSLPSFLWAATTANVTHFKTIYELSGPAAGLLKSLSTTSLSIVVEAFGKAGVRDAALHSVVSAHVLAKLGDFKPAELSRILWGFAASGVEDVVLARGISKALTDKSADLTPREASQALWALATLRRADKAVLDALTKSLKGKGGVESAADAGAAVWAAATLGYKFDTAALSAALKASVTELSAAQAIQSAWGLAVGGSPDKDAVSALFAAAAAAIDKAPDSLEVGVLAHLYEAAAAAPDAKLPDSAKAFALRVYGLALDADAAKRGAAAVTLRADVADAAALAAGARYRPEVTAHLKGFKRVTSEGVTIDLAIDLDKEKIALEVVDAIHLTTTEPHTPTGPALARAKVLNTLGYKAVLVPETEWAALKDRKAKAQWLLTAVRSTAPGASARLDALRKKLDEPFDAYAE